MSAHRSRRNKGFCRLLQGAVAVVATVALAAAVAQAGGDWNDQAIEWKTYDEGLAAAKAAAKPICLVFYTDWCPHCTRYSQIFHDPKVVEKSKQFVMIRLNKDENPALSAKYAPDGEYIPRTFFLSPDGELDTAIHEARANYLYFYSTADPASLLRAMDAAAAKYRKGD